MFFLSTEEKEKAKDIIKNTPLNSEEAEKYQYPYAFYYLTSSIVHISNARQYRDGYFCIHCLEPLHPCFPKNGEKPKTHFRHYDPEKVSECLKERRKFWENRKKINKINILSQEKDFNSPNNNYEKDNFFWVFLNDFEATNKKTKQPFHCIELIQYSKIEDKIKTEKKSFFNELKEKIDCTNIETGDIIEFKSEIKENKIKINNLCHKNNKKINIFFDFLNNEEYSIYKGNNSFICFSSTEENNDKNFQKIELFELYIEPNKKKICGKTGAFFLDLANKIDCDNLICGDIINPQFKVEDDDFILKPKKKKLINFTLCNVNIFEEINK